MALGEIEGEEMGRIGKMKGLRKYRDEKGEENHSRPSSGKTTNKTFTKHNSISFFISSCPLNVDILQLARPGNRTLCFLPMFDKGDHGG